MEHTESKGPDKYERIRRHYLETSPYNEAAYDSRFTACVGSNGNYGQDTICDGFCDAVQILLCSLMQNGDATADSIVYPVLFCVRHSIELYLKDVYSTILYIYCAKAHRDTFVKLQKLRRVEYWISQRLELRRGQLDPNGLSVSVDEVAVQKSTEVLERRKTVIEARIAELYDLCFHEAEPDVYTHDLKNLKERILNIYEADSRIKDAFDPVLPYLAYYEDIDPQGDAFRYLFSREGKPHLEKNRIQRVNLLAVGFQHEEIHKIFEELRLLLYCLRREYETGTFTKDLSREQLKEISKMLPPPQEFADKIKAVKRELKERYQIGSNKFDSALALIRRNREFSCNMGKELVFSHLSESTLRTFGECAAGRLDWVQASKGICSDELCLLFVFSDISGWRYMERGLAYYSEDLLFLYRNAKYEKRIDPHDLHPKEEICHVINGMRKCGQATYAAILESYIREGDSAPCRSTKTMAGTSKIRTQVRKLKELLGRFLQNCLNALVGI